LQYIQYRRQSLESREAKESFRGHTASDTLQKTLATAPPRGGGEFFLWGQTRCPSPAGAGAEYIL